MKRGFGSTQRDAVVLPLVTVSLIGLLSFVALAIDIGLMTVARSQCQSAADIAALAGARTLDGRGSNNNVANAIIEARQAAASNRVLNANISSGQITQARAGVYRYDRSARRFQAVFTDSPGPDEAYGLLQVTIITQQPTFFARVMGVQSLNVGATATAAHRPRDIAVVLDFSGSMSNATLFKYPIFGAVTGSLNPDPRFPRFGPWSIWGGTGMVLDPDNPGTQPADLYAYLPPTPFQRVWTRVDGGGESFGPSNLTWDTRNGPAIVNNFFLSDNTTIAFNRAEGSAFPSIGNVHAGTSSFPKGIVTPAPESFANQETSGFVGDRFPLRSGATPNGPNGPTPDHYAQTVADYLGIARSTVTNTTRDERFETNGYDWDFTTASLKPTNRRFQGFTLGPGYYGKTFYMWPPDPREPKGQIGDSGYVAGDWRRRFFLPRTGSTQDTRDNAMFWTSTGRWRSQTPGTNANYIPNYANILTWIKRGVQTLPPSLRSGRVIYYDTIPDSLPVDQRTGLLANSATADQRFWKDYIDYVIGAGRYLDSEVMCGSNSTNSNTRNGANLHYNNPSSTSLAARITARSALVSAAGTNPVPYMRYDDAPVHPRMQFWFGPMSMLAYLQHRVNWLSGTTYEAPCWQLKAGINSALVDIKNNHPNDLASLIYFSTSLGYNVSRVSLTRDYTRMQNALYYPFPLLSRLQDSSAAIRPFRMVTPANDNPAGIVDNTDTIIPNAGTQTCPEMGFKVAYNELSSTSINGVAYQGRRGAAKMVIFETDGVANTICGGQLTQGTNGFAYTGIDSVTFVGNSSALRVSPKDNARAVVRQIVALDTANPPGQSTARLPARVHAIGFGELFEPTTTSSLKPGAIRFLAAVQIDGNTSPKPGGNWDNDNLDYNKVYLGYEPHKIITGNFTERIEKLRQALERIMQSGVQVALIQ